MKLNALTKEQFAATCTQKMANVTQTAEAVTDIWPYVNALIDAEYPKHETGSWDVTTVYESNNGFQHVLIATDIENVLVAIIIDREAGRVIGHRLLNLNREYGLDH